MSASRAEHPVEALRAVQSLKRLSPGRSVHDARGRSRSPASSSDATSSGITSGGCWRSPSIVTTAVAPGERRGRPRARPGGRSPARSRSDLEPRDRARAARRRGRRFRLCSRHRRGSTSHGPSRVSSTEVSRAASSRKNRLLVSKAGRRRTDAGCRLPSRRDLARGTRHLSRRRVRGPRERPSTLFDEQRRRGPPCRSRGPTITTGLPLAPEDTTCSSDGVMHIDPCELRQGRASRNPNPKSPRSPGADDQLSRGSRR